MAKWAEKTRWEKLERVFYIFFVCLLFVWQFVPKPVPETVMINKKLYNKAIIVTDFVESTISAVPWNIDDERKCPGTLAALIPDDATPSYVGADMGPQDGWWREFMQADKNGWPKKCSLHRWGDGEIAVSLDWPSIGPLHEFPQQRQPVSAYSSNMFDTYNLVEAQVRTLVPWLERATGRRVKIVSAGEPSEYTKAYARIRIVPVDKSGFKITNREHVPAPPGDWHIASRESQFWGGVPFTNDARFQIDGYLLPKGDNTIGLAVCKYYPGYQADLVQALVTECMVRAMGIPESVYFDSGVSLIGPWNQNFLRNYSADMSPHARLSVYDMIMLRILYCPQLKPGMTRDEVVKVLMKNNDCFDPRVPVAAQPPRDDDAPPPPVVPVLDLAPAATRPAMGPELRDPEKDKNVVIP